MCFVIVIIIVLVYCFYVLFVEVSGGVVKLGFVCVLNDGVLIVVEVWEMLVDVYGSFVVGIVVLFGIGMLMFVDGMCV